MNYINFFEATILNNGATYNPITNESNPCKGYLVSLPKFEQRIEKDNFSIQHVKDYINCNSEVLNEKNFIGSWVNNNTVYLDISECISDKRKAIEIAYNRNQLAIYDAFKKEVILLPTPQRAGTTTQQIAYLKSVIDKLCK